MDLRSGCPPCYRTPTKSTPWGPLLLPPSWRKAFGAAVQVPRSSWAVNSRHSCQAFFQDASHIDRLALLSDPARLVAEVSAAGIDPQAEFDSFIRTACASVRSAFHGPLTYASGTWENVDWSQFDFVGVDAYRDAASRQGYPAMLQASMGHGRPVVITEFGCAAYRGAADAGALAWTAVDRTSRPPRLRDGIERDETEQAAEVADLLTLMETAGIEAAFIYTYISPTYPSSRDPAYDLDTASYALLRSWPDGRTERKAVYQAVAERYGRRIEP